MGVNHPHISFEPHCWSDNYSLLKQSVMLPEASVSHSVRRWGRGVGGEWYVMYGSRFLPDPWSDVSFSPSRIEYFWFHVPGALGYSEEVRVYQEGEYTEGVGYLGGVRYISHKGECHYSGMLPCFNHCFKDQVFLNHL